jgi:hypothetical protein
VPASDAEPAPIRLQVVGGGLGEWYEKRERHQEATPYVFVDVEEHPELLNLPAQAGEPGWRASAAWLADEAAIAVRIAAPVATELIIGLESPQLKPLIALIERDRTIAVCPTTPRLGINARLARDRSFFLQLPPRADA